MRHPFYMDHLNPEDQRTVKRWYLGIVVFYSSLALLALVIGAMIVNVSDPVMDAARRGRTTGVLQTNRLVRTSGAFAAEPAHISRCASRSPRLVTAIDEYGEAPDLPADRQDLAAGKPGDAFFFISTRARAACPAGRLGEALAIYDGIIIPALAAGK
jgi:hypothetical protein